LNRKGEKSSLADKSLAYAKQIQPRDTAVSSRKLIFVVILCGYAVQNNYKKSNYWKFSEFSVFVGAKPPQTPKIQSFFPLT
jgi:hypothetical protein